MVPMKNAVEVDDADVGTRRRLFAEVLATAVGMGSSLFQGERYLTLARSARGALLLRADGTLLEMPARGQAAIAVVGALYAVSAFDLDQCLDSLVKLFA